MTPSIGRSAQRTIQLFGSKPTASEVEAKTQILATRTAGAILAALVEAQRAANAAGKPSAFGAVEGRQHTGYRKALYAAHLDYHVEPPSDVDAEKARELAAGILDKL